MLAVFWTRIERERSLLGQDGVLLRKGSNWRWPQPSLLYFSLERSSLQATQLSGHVLHPLSQSQGGKKMNCAKHADSQVRGSAITEGERGAAEVTTEEKLSTTGAEAQKCTKVTISRGGIPRPESQVICAHPWKNLGRDAPNWVRSIWKRMHMPRSTYQKSPFLF